MSKSKIAFVVPEKLQRELHARIAHDGYGLRGKSRWVCEAIASLLHLNNFPELVHYSEDMQYFTKMETIVISKEQKLELDGAIITIRKVFPTIEGVQSSIARTAIMQRFLRG